MLIDNPFCAIRRLTHDSCVAYCVAQVVSRPQEEKTLKVERKPLSRDAQEYLVSLGANGIRLGLRRDERALDDLGQPEQHLRVLLVAGTNDKGSTCAMAASALRATELGLLVSTHSTFADALKAARRAAGVRGLVCATGSFSVVAEVRRLLLTPRLVSDGEEPWT